MKRFLSILIVLALVFSLAACAAKKPAQPAEKLYALTHEREAVYFVGADGAEKVYDLPRSGMTADVSGSTLWYVEGYSLVRVGLADGSKTEYALPENAGVGPALVGAENEAYVMLASGKADGFFTGAVYRVGANGAERVTSEYDWFENSTFAVDGSSVYYVDRENKLVREDADGKRTVFDWPGFPVTNGLSVDGGRLYACLAAECRSYDAVTGGDERIESGEEDETINIAVAHGGRLYYLAPSKDPTDSALLLKARSISDDKVVTFAKTADVGFYTLGAVLTFGERGFVLDDGYQTDDFRYIPYDAGE